ncbi:MAG: hypothetical protein NTX63_02755 [Candidatus Peregrinibacteria bacterium]|nr:hypothetical protein [Candidatus Peregrinibacteria bacterium]
MHTPHTSTKRPAVSLVIAMVMVMAFMLMAADVMQVMARTQNIAKGSKFSDQAQLNAQLGLELGLYAQNKPADFSTLVQDLTGSPQGAVQDANGNTTITDANGNTTSWKIADQTTGGEACYEKDWKQGTDNTMAGCDANKYFVYPYPGTGTAGGKDCDIKTQQLRKNTPWMEDMYYLIYGKKYSGDIKDAQNPDSTNFVTSTGDLYALDHPCLWNTLSSGSSAEIPLFRIGPDGKEIGADTITDLYIRARLPCKNGNACLEANRWKLLVTPVNKNTRALIWNIVANCTTDGLCYLSELGAEKILKGITDSVITYDIFNKPNYSMNIKNWILGYQVDGQIIKGQDGSKDQNPGAIKNFLNKLAPWATTGISKPYFHLSIAAPLAVSNGAKDQTVDSIEYQIIYKQTATTPLVTNPSVISQGSSGGYTTNLQSSLTKQTGSFNFSLVGK